MAEVRTAATASGAEGPSEENLLVDHLRRLGDNRSNVYAVHVHLSQLRPSNRQPNFVRIAARAFEPVVMTYDAALFRLSNADLVLVCRDAPVDEVDGAVEKARALFHEDPLTWGAESALGDRFTTWYDLSQPADHAAMTSHAAEMAAEAGERRQRATVPTPQAMEGTPLEPANLSAIDRRLQEVKVGDVARQQQSILVRGGARGEPLFRETYVSMVDLQRRVAPDVNLFASPWLFQYLTETLDKRVLAAVARRGVGAGDEVISLNLNVSTVGTREFQRFHQSTQAAANGTVIEIQLVDVLADLGAFQATRDLLKDQGYRVLIDGVSPLVLQYLDLAGLGADFVKIGWNRELLGKLVGERRAEIGDVVEEIGRERVVLARAETEDAVTWGLGLGIRRFQGHFVDRLVTAMSATGLM